MPKAKIVMDNKNNFFTNNVLKIASAQPTSGTYRAGDIVISSAPNSNAYGWICTASGTPGTWKILKSGADATSIAWANITGKPSTFPPTLGETTTTAYRGDRGLIAYNHSQAAHAPANAQKNSDITKAEIEAKLTGTITSHTHSGFAAASHGNHVPNVESANNSRFLRNDNTWQYVTPENIGAVKKINMVESVDNVQYIKICQFNDAGSGNVHAEILISGGGNFGFNDHMVGILRVSGRDDKKIQLVKLVSEKTYNAVKVGYTVSGTTTTVWLQRENYDGGSTITPLSNSGVTLFDQYNQSPTLNKPSGWIDGSNIMVYEYPKTSVVLPNNTALKGIGTNGTTEYDIAGVDRENNIFLGVGNQTYINVNNTIRMYRDLIVQTGATLYTPTARINGGNYSSLFMGPGTNNVRLEYAVGDCVYLAGNEANEGGYGTPFRAHSFQAVNPWIKLGGNYLNVSNYSEASAVGDVWIQNS